MIVCGISMSNKRIIKRTRTKNTRTQEVTNGIAKDI